MERPSIFSLSYLPLLLNNVYGHIQLKISATFVSYRL